MARFRQYIIPSITISGIAEDSYAVGRTPDGQVVFVADAVPGDNVDALVFRKKKGYLEGSLQHLNQASPERVEARCTYFGICGGCKWQHFSYEGQLREKENKVKQNIVRIGKVQAKEILPILPCAETFFYRNKLEFTFSNKRWLTREEMSLQETPLKEPGLGFHRPGAFDQVVDIDQCFLQAEPSNAIRNFIRRFALEQGWTFYNVRQQEGWLRNLIVRTSSMGEVMVILSVHTSDTEKINTLFTAMQSRYSEISTLLYVVNGKPNDSILDQDVVIWSGAGYIIEMLGKVKYKIGPKSFFQTNTHQAERLFNQVKLFAEIKSNDNVYDFYTGLGSIALFLADQCRQVIGVENVQAAIDDAKDNARLNGIENAHFICGDMKDIFNQSFIDTYGSADVVITDPPRAGMHPEVVQTLLQMAAPKIVYISCNPATQARDIQLLSEKYSLEKLQAVDMFPHTNHIESIALLKLNDINC